MTFKYNSTHSVSLFLLFLSMMSLPRVGTGIMAHRIIQWSFSTVDLKVLLNYNSIFYSIFYFWIFMPEGDALKRSSHLLSGSE